MLLLLLKFYKILNIIIINKILNIITYILGARIFVSYFSNVGVKWKNMLLKTYRAFLEKAESVFFSINLN